MDFVSYYLLIGFLWALISIPIQIQTTQTNIPTGIMSFIMNLTMWGLIIFWTTHDIVVLNKFNPEKYCCICWTKTDE